MHTFGGYARAPTRRPLPQRWAQIWHQFLSLMDGRFAVEQQHLTSLIGVGMTVRGQTKML